MNISPVSFCRTVKVNSSLKTAKQAVKLINSPQISGEQAKIQEELKGIFADNSEKDKAQVISIDGQNTYIISGEESCSANKMKSEMKEYLESASKFYPDEESFATMIEIESESYTDAMDAMLKNSQYSKSLNLETNPKSGKIVSLNFTA